MLAGPPLEHRRMLWLTGSLIILLAVLTQSVAGFGSAMVAMVLLGPLLGLEVAAPLVALVAFSIEIVVLARYRRAVNPRSVWQLVAGAVFGVPLGVVALSRLPETVTLPLLGLVVAGYALYGLLARRPPHLAGSGWAFGAGALAGMLGGAYNISGPPVIIYGDFRRWPPAEFRGNLQGFFLASDCLILTSHALAGNLTPAVWSQYALALPAIALGAVAGLLLAQRIPAARFRLMALWLLLILGARLIWPVLFA